MNQLAGEATAGIATVCKLHVWPPSAKAVENQTHGAKTAPVDPAQALAYMSADAIVNRYKKNPGPLSEPGENQTEEPAERVSAKQMAGVRSRPKVELPRPSYLIAPEPSS